MLFFFQAMMLRRHLRPCVVCISISALFAQTPTSTIRVPVRLVTVPALVFSSDDHLQPGLEASDFRVFDNGQLQKISLDTADSPVSVAIAIQVNQDVRDYLPFIAKVGSVFETLLLGEAGESALLTYADEVSLVKPFDGGDLAPALRRVKVDGRDAHLLDAAWRGLALLRTRQPARSRFLILIGQPLDTGSEVELKALEDEAETSNVTVFAITLPQAGKSFVSDNFSLQGPASAAERGGFKASTNLGKLISVLSHSAESASQTDPFSVLTVATGGAQFHVRKQNELEQVITAIGVDSRGAYQLHFSPSSNEAGYHTIKVEVDVPDARVLARPGYFRPAN